MDPPSKVTKPGNLEDEESGQNPDFDDELQENFENQDNELEDVNNNNDEKLSKEDINTSPPKEDTPEILPTKPIAQQTKNFNLPDSPPKNDTNSTPQPNDSPSLDQPHISEEKKSDETKKVIQGHVRNPAIVRAKSVERSSKKRNQSRARSVLSNHYDTSKMGTNSKKERLKSLFWKYAEISDETGATYLKSRNYVKLLTDCKIIDNIHLTKSKAEVTFSAAAGRKGMTFEAFFSTLVRLAELRYNEIFIENKALALEQIVNKHLLILSDISKEESIGIQDSQLYLGLVYDIGVKSMLNSVYQVIKDIYEGYFAGPFKKARSMEQISQITSKQLLTFVREFDLLKNNYLSKQTVMSMLNSLINTPEDNLTNNNEDPDIFFTNSNDKENMQFLTFGRFFIFLFWTAVVGFETTKADSMQYSNAEKVYFLLAKMELSKGFADLSKIYFKHYATPHSLLPSQTIINKIVINNPLYLRASSPNKNLTSVSNAEIIERSIKKHQYSPSLDTENENTEQKIEKQVSEYTEKLQKLFMKHSSINANSNTNKMTCFKFIGLLRSYDLIKGFSQNLLPEAITNTEAELLFRKTLTMLNEKNNIGSPQKSLPAKSKEDIKLDKLDFKAFFCAINQIAIKAYPDLSLSLALSKLCENMFSKENKEIEESIQLNEKSNKISPNSKNIDKTEEVLSDPKIIELKKHILKVVSLYFKSYTEDSIMEYEVFNTFCRDFSIFPELCNKATLHNIFYTQSLSRIAQASQKGNFSDKKSKPMPSEIKKRVLKSGEYLDADHFVNSLILCAMKSKAFDKESAALPRILHFMEKILQSDGLAKIKKMIGKTRVSSDDIDPMFEMRTKYKQYFERRVRIDPKQDLLDQVFPDEEVVMDNEIS